jgi:hypothetical protein
MESIQEILNHAEIWLKDAVTGTGIGAKTSAGYGWFLGGFQVNVPGSVFGSASPRKSSSLKLRAVYLDGAYRIAALWSPKDSGDTPSNLHSALNQMKQIPAKSKLADLIDSALPDLLPSDP